MKSSSNGEYEKLLNGFRKFAADIIPIAARTAGIMTTSLPAIDIIIVPNHWWRTTRTKIPLAVKYSDNDWQMIQAVSVYTPTTFSQRLKLYAQLQQQDPSYNYDSHLDFDAIIFVHQPPKPSTKEEELQFTLRLYASIASACFPLVVNYSLHCYGISPITDPMNDQNALAAICQLTNKLTPEQFAAKYGP
jgi:hypothetical protein